MGQWQNRKHVAREKINWFFTEESTFEVTEAGISFVSSLAEHNLSFSCGDHIIKFVKKHCMDPEVTKKDELWHTKSQLHYKR